MGCGLSLEQRTNKECDLKQCLIDTFIRLSEDYSVTNFKRLLDMFRNTYDKGIDLTDGGTNTSINHAFANMFEAAKKVVNDKGRRMVLLEQYLPPEIYDRYK